MKPEAWQGKGRDSLRQVSGNKRQGPLSSVMGGPWARATNPLPTLQGAVLFRINCGKFKGTRQQGSQGKGTPIDRGRKAAEGVKWRGYKKLPHSQVADVRALIKKIGRLAVAASSSAIPLSVHRAQVSKHHGFLFSA